MKNAIRFLCLIMALFMIVPFAACSINSDAGSKDTVTVTDHNGDTVVLPADIKRIAVCDILPLPSVLAVFFDSAEKIIAMSPSSMSAAKNSLLSELYPEILNADTGFINGSEVNAEELMKLKPDVVFYNASSKELGESLKKNGFKAVAVSVNKWGYNAIETLNNWISLLSQIFPQNDKSEKVRAYSDEVYKMVQERTSSLTENQRARVFFLFQYNDSTIMTSGKLFFGEWWAEAIGAVNVARELTTDNSVKVNMEQIYSWNPGIIFMTNFTTAQPDDLYNNSIGVYKWDAVDAVKNKAVYKMPLGMYRSYTPGVDTPITLMWLAKTAYPDLFADIDITEKTIDYYKNVFGITLTETQAEAIFFPQSAAGSVRLG